MKESEGKTQHLSFARHFTWTISFNSQALVHKWNRGVNGHADGTMFLKFRWPLLTSAKEAHLTPQQTHQKQFFTLFLMVLTFYILLAIECLDQITFPLLGFEFHWWVCIYTFLRRLWPMNGRNQNREDFILCLIYIVYRINQVWIFKHLWNSFPTNQKNCSFNYLGYSLGN